MSDSLSPKATISRLFGSQSSSAQSPSSPTGGGGGSGGGGGILKNTSTSSSSSPNILRRRTRDLTNPFELASRVVDVVVDNVGMAAKRVTLESITTSIANIAKGDKKSKESSIASTAAPGVAQAYSVILQHICAPLWTIEQPRSMAAFQSSSALPSTSAPSSPQRLHKLDQRQFDMCGVVQLLDSKTHEQILPMLSDKPDLTTAYIVLLLWRLALMEGGEAVRMSWPDVLASLMSEKRNSDDDIGFEEKENDEQHAPDHSRRPLQEVGGRSWKPKGAASLPLDLHNLRHDLMHYVMKASVCFRYNYTDPLLHFVLEDIACRKLFLTSFSEGFVGLVAGIKHATYLSKYFLFLSTPLEQGGSRSGGAAGGDGNNSGADGDSSFYQIRLSCVDSVALQQAYHDAFLAVQNFIHRNDTSHVVLKALTIALLACKNLDETLLVPNLLYFLNYALRLSYVADLECLVALIDAVKIFVAKPNPVGGSAAEAIRVLSRSIANTNVIARDFSATLFVGGARMRSFRRQTAFVLTSPYCARASLFNQILWTPAEMSHGANVDFPCLTPSNVNYLTRESCGYFDDTSLYIANQAINIFQALYELQTSQNKDSAVSIKVIFGIPHHQLIPFFPKLFRLLGEFTMNHQLTPALVRELNDIYISIQDAFQPVKGQMKLRMESPRVPISPTKVYLLSEEKDSDNLLKSISDDYFVAADQRMSDKETAFLHPDQALSLRQHVENRLRLVVCAGGGVLRRVATSLLRIQQLYPGNLAKIQLYLIPFGFANDMACWLARQDPIYHNLVLAPFLSHKILDVEHPTPELMTQAPKIEAMGLSMRMVVNNYVQHALEFRDVAIYQAECWRGDTAYYIPFVTNFEVGMHINLSVASNVCNDKDAMAKLTPPQSHLSTFSEIKTKRSLRALATMARVANRMSSAFGGPVDEPNASFASTSSTPGIGPSPMPLADVKLTHNPRDYAQVIATPNGTCMITFGDMSEAVDRVLVRMHGTRGIKLSNRKAADGPDLVNVCTGSDVLDWVSTTYHVYDSRAAEAAAQSLLSARIIVNIASNVGRDSNKFFADAIYTLLPREELDSQPLCCPGRRSALCEAANINKIDVEEAIATTTNTVVPSMRCRVTFAPGDESDLQYNDLFDSSRGAVTNDAGDAPGGASTAFRDIFSLKLKSTGSPGDYGSPPSPTSIHLTMSIHEIEKKKLSRPREIGDVYEQYQLVLGRNGMVDPKACLNIEHKPPTQQAGPAAEAAAMGLFCMCDGDVFGPFSRISVRAVMVKPDEGKKENLGSLRIMTFSKNLAY